MHLLTIPFRSSVVALILLAAACAPQPTGADAVPQPAPWCAVETGIAGPAGKGEVGLHTRTISGLAVLPEALTVTEPEYRSEFNDRVGPGSQANARAAHLADGTWLVAFAGGGAWYEYTSCLLQLDTSGGTVGVRSASLEWNVDIPPVHAWVAVDGAFIHLDDSDFRTDGRVRVDFRIEGEVVDANGPPASGAHRVWSTGRFSLTLKDGVLPPLPDDRRAWFEALAAGR